MRWIATAIVVALATARAAAGPLALGRAELFGGYHADGYSTLDERGALFGGVQLDLELSVTARIAAQLEVMTGAFSNRDRAAAAAYRMYYRDEGFAVGASAGYTTIFGQQDGETVALFAERYEARSLLVSGAVGYERKQPRDDLVFGELFLHMVPAEHLLVVAGVSYAQAEIKQTRADIIVRVEYAPVTAAGITFAGYLQYGGNVFTRASSGIVMYFDTLDVATRERTRGVHGLRFK